MAKAQYPKLQGTVINAPVKTDKTDKRLPDIEYTILVKLQKNSILKDIEMQMYVILNNL